MPGVTFIKGKKVDLRTVEPEDLEFIHRGVNHPSIAQFLSATPSNMIEVEDQFERRTEGDNVQLLIVPREGEFADEPVGMVYMNPIGSQRVQAIAGLWLVPEAQRNKFAQDAVIHFGTYAFEKFKIHRMEVRTSEKNTVIQRMCERLGFTHEGTIREREFREGEYCDLELYGMLADEWPGTETLLEEVFG